MSSEANPEPNKEPETITQEVKYSQVSARVTEKVSSGVFSSGALLLNGQNEFIAFNWRLFWDKVYISWQ